MLASNPEAKMRSPDSPRERNLLNILAHCNLPLENSDLICDITQTISWSQMRFDGMCPTLATKSRMWVFRLGRELTPGELMDLMGMPAAGDFGGLTPSACRHLLGNSMHVAEIGLVCGIGFGICAGLL